MEFHLTRSQKEIQKAAGEFAKGEFDKDLSRELGKQSTFPEGLRKKAAELGFIGIHWPEAYEGGGLGILENTLIAEEFCKNDSSLGIALSLSGFAAESLLLYGTNELKQKYLPRIATGEMVSGAAFFEPGEMYDISITQTTARADGDYWVIDGKKSGVLNGGQAGWYCVLCHTGSEKKSPDSLSMFLVEADSSGLSAAGGQDKLGMRMVATTDLHFKGVRVPRSHLIGTMGMGMKQAKIMSDLYRILVAAMAIGTARGAFIKSLTYVKQREQFGKKIGKLQVTRHKLAEMALSIEQSALMTLSAAWHFDKRKKYEMGIAMAKLSACRTALAVSDEAIQLLGGYGYMTEYEVERC
jgi:alkylation response protein AidB-like acyl-CoA dehydrogenase